MSTEVYDAVIIGSGMAGLYMAIQLQKKGRRVLLVEKEAILGGRSLTFKQKIDGLDLQWEAGAGRISVHHSLVRSLIRRYKLSWIPIKGHPTFIKDFGSAPQDAPFEHGIPVFFHPIYALPKEELAKHTIRELLTRIHGPTITDDYLVRYPYRGEVDTLRADVALPLFQHEMGLTESYGICGDGLSALISGMHKEFEAKGGKTLLKHTCVAVSQKDLVSVELMSETQPVVVSGRHCVLAVPVAALTSVRPFETWKSAKKVAMRPLLRFYGVFPLEGGQAWTEGVGRIVTPRSIRYMIPGNPAIGSAQISYTDSQDAEFWKKKIDASGEKAVGEEIVAQLRQLIKPTIPGPTFVKSHYWEDGVSYWLPGLYDPKEISQEAYTPFPTMPGIHVCGESFSMKQAWMEGALEHAEGLARQIEKKLSHR